MAHTAAQMIAAIDAEVHMETMQDALTQLLALTVYSEDMSPQWLSSLQSMIAETGQKIHEAERLMIGV